MPVKLQVSRRMKRINSKQDLAINGASLALDEKPHIGSPNIGDKGKFLENIKQFSTVSARPIILSKAWDDMHLHYVRYGVDVLNSQHSYNEPS